METDALLQPKPHVINKLSIRNNAGEVIHIAYSLTEKIDYKTLERKRLECGEYFNLPEKAGFLVIPTQAGVYALMKVKVKPAGMLLLKDRFALGTLEAGQSFFTFNGKKYLSPNFAHASVTIRADGAVAVEEE